nr:putative ribonuclease H-like domain-containing protein [Tanacetum cinerariifolium]
KSWLWHQRLSHLNFDTINDLARNDLVAGLPKLKYHKEHLFPSREQGKSKRASHPPKPIPNSRQRLHLLHMDLCGPMRLASINGKRKPDILFLHVFGALCYPKNDHEDIGKLGAKGDIGFFIGYSANSCAYRVYNHQTKKIMETMNVSFDELSAMAFEQSSSKLRLNSMTSGKISSGLDLTYAPSTITTQQPSEEFKNQVLKEYFDSVGISHQVSSVRTPQQNGVVKRKNRTLVEAARTMLIFSRAPLFLWAEVIATACFTQNRSIIHRHFNKKLYELINGRKPDISFLYVFGALCYLKNDREDIGKLGAKGLDLTYALSTITTQQPTEGELDLLFEAMYDDYIGGQPSAAQRTVPTAQAQQVSETSTTSTSIADNALTPTNSSSQATNFPNTSQDVDGLSLQQQQAQQQGNQASIQPETVADNVPNAMFDANSFVNPFATSSTSAAE